MHITSLGTYMYFCIAIPISIAKYCLRCYPKVMSIQKSVVREYIAGFNALDHEKILSTLTDDVEWILPGVFHHRGKEAFDKEIENPNFSGIPIITITRLTEEGNIVVAEGKVLAQNAAGQKLPLIFCDVFEFRDEKICTLTVFITQDT